MDLKKMVIDAKQLLESGASCDSVLQSLRDRGCSKGHCVAILAAATRCGLSDAKRIVHFSNAWVDRKQSDEHFEERVVAAIESVAKEQDKADANTDVERKNQTGRES